LKIAARINKRMPIELGKDLDSGDLNWEGMEY
jgi:hypothetical protein